MRQTQRQRLRWLPCQNNSSSVTIPAYGLVRVVSVAVDGTLTVDQPNTNSQDVLVVGRSAIPPGAFGVCTRDDPIAALYNASDGTPAVGDTWGAGSGSYLLRKANTGFTVYGGNVPGTTYSRTCVYRAASSGGSSGADHTCRLTAVSTGGMSGGSTNVIQYASAAKDTDSFFNSVSHPTRITIPSGLAGDYAVFVAFGMSGNISSPVYGTCPVLTVKKNGSATSYATAATFDASAGGTSEVMYCYLYYEDTFAVGDFLEISIKNNTASNFTPSSPSLFGVRKLDKAG